MGVGAGAGGGGWGGGWWSPHLRLARWLQFFLVWWRWAVVVGRGSPRVNVTHSRAGTTAAIEGIRADWLGRCGGGAGTRAAIESGAGQRERSQPTGATRPRKSRTMNLAPKAFLASIGVTSFEVGDVLNPTDLGMPDSDKIGTMREVTITEVTNDGSYWTHGDITCRECGETRNIGSGDWFQLALCPTCKKEERKATKKAVKVAVASSPEQVALAAQKAEKATQAKLAKDAERAKTKADAAQKKVAEAVAAAEKAALIAKVAAEKGVEISEKAEQVEQAQS